MNMNSTEAERFEKGKSICELYATRRFRQEDLASILCMSLFDVRKTLKLFNFEHTIQKTPDNSRPHQMVNMCVSSNQLSYLDKYDSSIINNAKKYIYK